MPTNVLPNGPIKTERNEGAVNFLRASAMQPEARSKNFPRIPPLDRFPIA